MKKITSLLVFIMCFSLYAQDTNTENSVAAKLAQEQLDAYNKRDIEAFLKPYSEDVEVYAFPDKLLYTGKATMRTQYTKMFKEVTNLYCELKSRMVQNNMVIDQEYVRFGDQYVNAIAIYHIENNKIQKVYFLR